MATVEAANEVSSYPPRPSWGRRVREGVLLLAIGLCCFNAVANLGQANDSRIRLEEAAVEVARAKEAEERHRNQGESAPREEANRWVNAIDRHKGAVIGFQGNLGRAQLWIIGCFLASVIGPILRLSQDLERWKEKKRAKTGAEAA